MKIDGKEVRYFLFGRYSRVVLPGAIPVDRKERAHVLAQSDQPRFLVLVSVEAFTKDHAVARLCETWQQIERREWEFVEELDASHSIGAMGTHLPLNPLVVAESRLIQ